MDDVVALAHFQCAAQVDAQADDLAPGKALVLLQVAGDGGEQLHADEDVPADAVLVGVDGVVLIADDVAVALELAHEGDLAVEVLDVIPEVGGRTVPVHAVRKDLLQLVGRGWDGDGLQRAGEHGVELVAALDLEHLAVAACTDIAFDVPRAEKRLVALIVFVVHDVPHFHAGDSPLLMAGRGLTAFLRPGRPAPFRRRGPASGRAAAFWARSAGLTF